MTARPQRRRRRTIVGAALGAVLAASAAGLTALGANAVINSTEGEAVAGDTRPVVSLPPTDNAALAVVDAENRLTSLVVVTLLPTGEGGSIVTIPVAADASLGFGDTRQPLDELLDPADPAAFFQQVEATLAITLQFGEIVGAERLQTLLAPTLPFTAEIPADVFDTSADPDGEKSEPMTTAGQVEFDGSMLAETLQAIDLDVSERTRHAIDVAVWTGVAQGAPADGAAEVPVDAVGSPQTSASVDELFARLWSGPVQARDVALVSPRPPGSDNAVALDRRDVVLVFAQVSPARVSAPNPGPVFRLEIPIADGQLASSDAGFASRRDVALNVIGQLFFLQANVASVDATANPDGAPTITRIEVANGNFVETMRELGPQLFGEVEVVVAEERVDGIDVVVKLGTGYLVANVADVPTTDETVDTEPGTSTPDDAATVDTDG